jgi:antitoxin VapB
MQRKAKVFWSGRSQAVRLPAEFRFEGNEVFIRRDPASGDLVLSNRPSLQEIFRRIDEIGLPEDFLADRQQPPLEERDLW